MSTVYGLHRALLLNRNGEALMFEGRSRTWAEVGDRVARLAGAMQNIGVKKGDRVAVLMLNQDRYLELYLAVAWIGAAIVPLNIRWSALENEVAVRDCRPTLLFVDAAFVAMGAAITQKVGSIQLAYADDAPAKNPLPAMLEYEQLVASSEPMADVEAHVFRPCWIFYTGGTTGRSKGVMLSHRNLMATSKNHALCVMRADFAFIERHLRPLCLRRVPRAAGLAPFRRARRDAGGALRQLYPVAASIRSRQMKRRTL